MRIAYLFSDPRGDIPVTRDVLALPFKISPSEDHPFLRLKDYFQALEGFMLKDRGRPLISVLKDRLDTRVDIGSIRDIRIRSEKHGALYHLASIEVFVGDERVKLTISTAVTEIAKEWLTDEYEIIRSLNSSLALPYLPTLYFKGEVTAQSGRNRAETLVMVLGEWFEGYYEWHISANKGPESGKITIWDGENGYRSATTKESFEIFREASRILTLYYDTVDFRQIYPWHHAAGDFIVKTGDDRTDLRLTTVRKYRSIMEDLSKGSVDPMISLVYFFLNLTIRMRLDKLDGVGATVWAGDFAVDAAIQGFFEALRAMTGKGRLYPGTIQDLLSLLRSFKKEELERLFEPLLGLYQEESAADFCVIQANLKSHIHSLCRAFRDVRL